MDKNFIGQNLNGHSFRGQDLRGADFSGCQLKSCDFTGADLTGAKFFRATMGIDGRRRLVKRVAAFLLGIISGFLVWFLNHFFAEAINEAYKSFTGTDTLVEKSNTLLLLGSLYAASSCLSVLAALKYRDWRIVTGYLLVIIIAVTVLALEAVTALFAGAGAGAGAGAVTVTVAALALALPGALAIAGAFASLSAGAGAAGAAMTAIYLLLCWYLSRSALQCEMKNCLLFKGKMYQ